ncbi:PH domain-containing protein [Candidatus Berkelbacteria bacterium]|nr:PH domain-containing protein [Candidatus Berkelbacteria bacterium]
MIQTNLVTGKESDLFPGQLENEEILIFVRRHWMAFAGWLLFVLVMLIIPIVIFFTVVSYQGIGFFKGLNLVLTSLTIGGYLLITDAVFLTAWIEHYLDVAIITPERLLHVKQVGLFNRRVAELSLLRVQDVSAQMNGYIQTFFRYGTVVVESAGEAPNFVMNYVPKPHVIANTILMLNDRLAMRIGTAGHEEIMSPRALELSQANSKEAELQSRLKQLHAHAPHDYDPDHFHEDLVTQTTEAKEHLQEIDISPNRLPPARGSASLDGELTEGKTVSLGEKL